MFYIKQNVYIIESAIGLLFPFRILFPNEETSFKNKNDLRTKGFAQARIQDFTQGGLRDFEKGKVYKKRENILDLAIVRIVITSLRTTPPPLILAAFPVVKLSYSCNYTIFGLSKYYLRLSLYEIDFGHFNF